MRNYENSIKWRINHEILVISELIALYLSNIINVVYLLISAISGNPIESSNEIFSSSSMVWPLICWMSQITTLKSYLSNSCKNLKNIKVVEISHCCTRVKIFARRACLRVMDRIFPNFLFSNWTPFCLIQCSLINAFSS